MSACKCFKLLHQMMFMRSVLYIQQCRFLGHQIGTSYPQCCLQDPHNARSIIREAKQHILSRNWASPPQVSKTHPSLAVVSTTHEIASTWNRIWDKALEFGVNGTRLIQGLFAVLSRFLEIEAAPGVKILSPRYTPSIYLQHISPSTALIQWYFGWRISTSRS